MDNCKGSSLSPHGLGTEQVRTGYSPEDNKKILPLVLQFATLGGELFIDNLVNYSTTMFLISQVADSASEHS